MTPGERKTIAAVVIAGSLCAVVAFQYDTTAMQGVLAAFGLGVIWGHYVWQSRGDPPDDHVTLSELRRRADRAEKEQQ